MPLLEQSYRFSPLSRTEALTWFLDGDCGDHWMSGLAVTDEADVTVGPLIFLGKTSDHGVEGSTSSPTSVMVGLGLATVVTLTLATIVLGVARRRRAAAHLVCPVSASQ